MTKALMINKATSKSYPQKLPPPSPIAIILLSHPYGLKEAQNPLPYHQYTSRVILRAYNSDINLIPTNDFSQNIWYVGKYGRYIITGIYHHVISLQQFLY